MIINSFPKMRGNTSELSSLTIRYKEKNVIVVGIILAFSNSAFS